MQFDPRDNAFEPVYEGQEAQKPVKPLRFEDLENNGRPRLLVADAGTCAWPAGVIVAGIVFDRCDFRGIFSDITFKECTFERCSFAAADFRQVKFSGCSFSMCTFTLSGFSDCSLIGCKYRDNWASNEHFLLANTDVSAATFLSGLTPYLDHVDDIKPKTTVPIQKARARVTLSKVARKILKSCESSSNEDLYDEAYGTAVMASVDAKIAEAGLKRSEKRSAARVLLALYDLRLAAQKMFLKISGVITGWQTGVLRPAAWGLIITLTFGTLYSVLGEPVPYAFRHAFEVTVIAGFTNHQPESHLIRTVHEANLLIGLFWFGLVSSVIFRRAVRG